MLTLGLIAALLADPSPARGATLLVAHPTTLKNAWIETTPLLGNASSSITPIKAGTALTELPVPPVPAFEVCAGAENIATVCQRRTPDDRSTMTPAWDSGQEVRGRVMTGKEPVGRARVSLIFTQLAGRNPFTIPLGRETNKLERWVLTSPEGTIALPHVAPGDYRLEVTLPSGLLLQSRPFCVEKPKRTIAPHAPITLPDIEAPTGLALRVLALDDQGTGVPNTRVAITQGEPPDSLQQYEATTDTTGRATLAGLQAARPLRIACIEPNHVRYDELYQGPPEQALCTMPRLASFTTTITTEKDEPLPSAVATTRVDGRRVTAQANAAGVLRLRRLPPGPRELVFSAPDHESVTTRVELAPGDEYQGHRVQLPPADTFVGRITDQETGNPIAQASVGVLLPTEYSGAATDDRGLFHLRLPHNDTVRLRITADGYATASITLPSDSRGTTESPYPVTIGHGGRIHVSIWDEDADAPCTGCTVFVTGTEEPTSLTTDTNGSTTSDLLAPRTYVLIKETAHATGSIVTVAGGDDTRLAHVTPGATVDVTFGEPSRWLTLTVLPNLDTGWLVVTQSTSRSDVVAPQPDGSFRIRRPKKEPLTLFAMHGPTRVRLTEVPAEYRDTTLQYSLPSGGAQGVLAFARGAIRIMTTMLMGETSTDELGHFLVPFLPAGIYTAVLPNGTARVFSLQEGTVFDLGTIKDK